MSSNLPDKYSFSLVQQDIFYDQLHHIGSPKYNIGGYVSLGSIDENKLKQAHRSVVLNNRMFGMYLTNQADGVFVALAAVVNTELPLVDLSTAVDPERAAQDWIDNVFTHPFDLYGQGLFHTWLLKLSNEKYFYVAIAHHLLVDGWGIANWARQLGNYYSNETPELESTDDFLAYYTQDIAYLQSNRYLKDQEFWRDYLQGQPVRLFSPLRTRSVNADKKCSQRLCFDISVELFEQAISASDLLQKNEHSLFFALVALYFSRITQRQHITIGVPAHNRRGAVHKKLIGLYTSVSPVKIELQDDWSFLELVEMVKVEQAKVFRHQKYPLGHMVRDLGPAARAGLFDIGVNYLKLDNKFAYGDSFAPIRYVENHYQTTPFNLTVWDNGENQPVQLQIDFSLEHFTPEDIQLIGARLLYLLQQVAHNPDIRIGELDVVAPAERPLIWQESSVAVTPETPFIHLFEQQVMLQPERLALSCLQQHFSYRQLNELSELLALQLSERGVGAGNLVGLLLGRRPEMVIAILALHKLGAAYLPLDPSYPAARLHFMVEDSQCKLLLTSEDLLSLSAGLTADTLMVDNLVANWHKTHTQANNADTQVNINYSQAAQADQLAYVIYTSGSTGKPKGVMLSQLALSNFLQSMAQTPGFGADDCLLAITPFSFDISILELLLPLMRGGSVRLFHTALTQDVAGFIRDLHDYPVTMLQMTPSAWKILLAAGWQGSPTLKALTGGEALPAHVAEAITPMVKELWNMYGPTETTIWSSCVQVQLPRLINSIGAPIANTQMLVLDAGNRALPVGVFGMLYIGGTGLAEGYWRRPELTAERFITLFNQGSHESQRWYQTGDIARLLPSGEYEFQGRADHQVKINGYRIELGEIESLLSRYPGIANSAVLIKTLASGRQVLCAYYQSHQGISEEDLKTALACDLPSFMLPSVYINVPVFPQTPGGKTDLNALPEPEIVTVNARASNEPVRDELTTRLLDLIKAHLNITHLEPGDNLFDVGASSIDVTEISVKISRELEQTVSVIDMFSHPSVRALVNFLQAKFLQAKFSQSHFSQSHTAEQQSAQRLERQENIERGKSRLNNRLKARKLLDEV